MIPDNSKKRLEQLRQEMAFRAQLQQQYDKEMSGKYTRDMPSFADWLGQRQQPKKMSEGGSTDDDYRSEHTAPSPEFGAPMHDVTRDMYPKDFYGPSGFHIYADYGEQKDRDAYNKVVRVKGKPNEMVSIHRAIPTKVYKEALKKDSPLKHMIRKGDWVAINKDYAKEHGEGVLLGDYKIASMRVPAKHVWTNADSIHEWGYHPDEVIKKAQGGTVNPFDYENPKHVNNVAGIASKHKDFSQIPDAAKHLAGALSQGSYKFIEDPRIQSAIKQAGHSGYFINGKDGKQQIIHKAEGGAVLPIEQIKAQMMNKFKGLSTLQSIGAEEAPSLGVKAYVPTIGRPDNGQMPVGGIDTQQGDLPVGGIDMNTMQQGQQLMPNAPPAPAGMQQGMNQVPQGDKIPTMDGTGMPPAPNSNPNQMGSNILSMTPQGQAMAAMKPQGLAKGGQVSIDQMKRELSASKGLCMTHDHGYADGGSVFEEADKPRKTVKAYKLFRTDKKKPGKLFPLFVDANTPVETGKWLAAKEGEMRGSKVKSKIGDLAYRPGWHAGDLPVATHIGEKSHPSLTAPDTRPENHVWAEVEMPHDVDWQSEANKRGTNAKGKLIPVKAHITDQIPHGGHYRYKTNPNMTGNWLIGGAMKVNRVLSDAEVKKINKAAGVSDLPRAKKQKLSDYGFAEGGTVNLARGGMPFAIQSPKALPKAPEEFTPYDDSKPSIPSLAKAFDEAIAHHLSLSNEDRLINSQRAAMQVAHHIGMTSSGKPKDLLGQNEKLLKSGKGIEGQEPVKLPDGRGVETTGLALAPAYEEGNFNTCPNHHSCKAECLGKTSGNYFKLGGGQDLSEFKGPRLNSLLKTNAFLRDPHALAVKLYDEIDSAKQMAAANGNHLGVRLNVLSDINPRVHKAIIEAHPDVTFYDYTKNNTNPIAPNHHYTYSSTGVSQPGVDNPHTNWKQMRRRLDQGDNVAMAFSHKDHLPTEVHDQETGKKYKVIDGDTHDFRPLDLVGEGEDGVIVGLKNKKATGKMDEAHIDSKGFFLHYDPQLKMSTNAKGQPVYARTASNRISEKTGKPMLGETIPQNRTVNIQPQTRGMIPLTNDGEKQ